MCKKLMPLICVFTFSYNFLSAQDYTILGVLKNSSKKNVILTIKDSIVDSTLSINDTFKFKGSLIMPSFSSITVADKYLPFILEATSIEINGDMEKIRDAKIVGAELNTKWKKVEENSILPYRKKLIDNSNQYSKLISEGDSLKANFLLKENSELVSISDSLIKNEIIKDNDIFGLFILVNFWERYGVLETKRIIESYNYQLQDHGSLLFLKGEIEKKERLNIGKSIIDFSLPNLDGDTIFTQNYRGKVLLIDFWASWCLPCRKQHPKLVEVYDKFKNKGFEIIGISTDTQKENWLNIVKKDNLKWEQVSDLQKPNKVALIYYIKSIPNNFLISTEGIIIAKNLTPIQLEKILMTILK